MVIGVTGNSGSGKTFIAERLAIKINAIMINADEIVKEMSLPGKIYYNEIIKTFGNSFLKEDNTLNKAKLAETIFRDVKQREILNHITNKYIVPEIIRRSEQSNTNVVLDVPLLFESGIDKKCNVTIAVISDENLKLQRIISRDKIKLETAKLRLQAQPDELFYKENADYVIMNNEKNIEEQICFICNKIRSKYNV